MTNSHHILLLPQASILPHLGLSRLPPSFKVQPNLCILQTNFPCPLLPFHHYRRLFYSLLWQFSYSTIYYQDLCTWVSFVLPHNNFFEIRVSCAATWHSISCKAKHTFIHASVQQIFIEHHLCAKPNASEWHPTMNKIDIVSAPVKCEVLWGIETRKQPRAARGGECSDGVGS